MTDTSLFLTEEDVEKEHRMFLRRLAADTKKAAASLKSTEARYLVDLYYQIQDFRKAAANQSRAHKQFGEPNYLVGFVGDQMKAMENLIRRSMGHYAANDPTGLWSQSIVGVGPVTSAALLAHIDIRKANTVGKIWRFCFPPGTLINTPEGMRRIEDLEAGDEVLNHLGRPTSVVRRFQRVTDEGLVNIKARGVLPVSATREHPFWVRKTKTSDPEWVEAGSIKPDMWVGLPVSEVQTDTSFRFNPSNRAKGKQPLLGEPFDIDVEMAWFLGRFVADGSTCVYSDGEYQRGNSCITFAYTDSADETSRCENVAQRFGSFRWSDTGTSKQLYFGALTVANGLSELVGHGAENKKIPYQILYHPDIEVVKSFVLGYFSGDGHVVKDGRTAGWGISSTVSLELATGLQHLLLRLGIFSACHKSNRSFVIGEIRGRKFNQKPYRYVLSVRPNDMAVIMGKDKAEDSCWTNRRPVMENGFFWTPVTEVREEDYVGEVFNIETEDHTYTAMNLAVHNCGLDPTVTWGKGQKRPWNAKLKVVCWHIGECFKKFSKREDCLYGRLYRVRKQFEINRNEQGYNREVARITLETKKIGKDTPTYAAYAEGKLPPGRLDLRATRFATKIFLSHWHEVAYRYHHGEKPARPYAIAILGHADYIPVPNYPWDDDAKQQEVFEFWDRMFKAVPVAAADETEESEDDSESA